MVCGISRGRFVPLLGFLAYRTDTGEPPIPGKVVDRDGRLLFTRANIMAATLFPLGVLQLYHSVKSGYFDARTLQFIAGGANPVLEWLRLPGDLLFIVGGVLPILYLCWLSIRYVVPAAKPGEEEREILFTDVETK